MSLFVQLGAHGWPQPQGVPDIPPDHTVLHSPKVRLDFDMDSRGGLDVAFARQVPLRDAGLPAASQVPPVGPPPAARASEQVSPAGPTRTRLACVDMVACLQHWHDRPEHRGQPDGAGDAHELRLLAARAGWLVGVLARPVRPREQTAPCSAHL